MGCLMCGPKLAACGLVLGAWGVIMLAMLGIFFTTHSAVLIEDVPLEHSDMPTNMDPDKVYAAFNDVGYNCFIAAGVYAVVGVFSCCQMRLNKQREYLVR